MKKPVRVTDIMRREPPAKPGAVKVIASSVKNTTKAVFGSSGAKILIFIVIALALVEVIPLIKTRTETIFQKPAPKLSGAAKEQNAATNIPQEAAVSQSLFPPLSIPSTSTATDATTSAGSYGPPPEITPGLLPMVGPTLPKPTSTATKTTSTTTSSKKTAVQPTQSKPAAIPTTPTVITAKSFLDATTISLNERFDGPYKVTFTTNAGTYGKITWGLDKPVFTVGGNLPNFSVSFSCDPPPNAPPYDAIDQSPTFNVRATYNCTVGLTPASGGDTRTQSKQFSFTTGSGQLVVTPPQSMITVLKESANFGGFVFRNDDTEPVTITGLDIDVFYKGLNVADGPLVLRFVDPSTELPLTEYRMEGFAADPSVPFAHSATNISVPLSFTINAANPKMLPLNVLGVRRLSIYGVDPTVIITLRGVTTNKTVNKIVFDSAKLSWSCIVPIGINDPNATSGPFATGQACQQ